MGTQQEKTSSYRSNTWQSFSFKNKAANVKSSSFNQVSRVLVTRKNSEPLLKEKISKRAQFSRQLSTTSQKSTSPWLTKSTSIDEKPALLKSLSKSTSNIASSKSEASFKGCERFEKYNKKFTTVVSSTQKQVLSRSRSGDLASIESTNKNISEEVSKKFSENVLKSCDEIVDILVAESNKG